MLLNDLDELGDVICDPGVDAPSVSTSASKTLSNGQTKLDADDKSTGHDEDEEDGVFEFGGDDVARWQWAAAADAVRPCWVRRRLPRVVAGLQSTE
jgi:hypothetical protein